MAVGYVLGVLLVVGLAQANPTVAKGNPAFLEDLKGGSTRVVGGWPAQQGQIPYQISLRMINAIGSVSSCGGSVIHNNWVITAAHCVANRLQFVIRLCTTNLTEPGMVVETDQKFIHPRYNEIQAGVQTDDIALLRVDTHIPFGGMVVQKFIHPRYNEIQAGVQTDDIALLRVDTHIPFGACLQPARLQNSENKFKSYLGVRFVVSGFGRTDDLWNGGAASEILLWTHLRGITNEECREWYNNSPVIQAQTVCAEYYNSTEQSSCQGDSGGPLTFVDSDGLTTMVGIVSFGSSAGCNSPFPSAYVRPDHYHDWYLEVTGIDFDWKNEDILPPTPEEPEQPDSGEEPEIPDGEQEPEPYEKVHIVDA